MDPETRKLLDDLNRTFAEFKTANDERISQLETRGSVDAVLTTKVDKLNATITDIEEKLRSVENTQARASALGGPRSRSEGDEINHARIFQAIVNRVKPNRISDAQVNVEGFRAYKAAFNDLILRGPHQSDVQAALQTGSDPDGGYLVPPDTSAETIRLIHETSAMRQLATVTSTMSNEKGGLLDLERGTSGGWVTELQSRPKTGTPQRGRWTIPIHEQYAQPAASQTDLDDEPDGESWLANKVAEEIVFTENAAFFTGDGVGKPRGILTYAAGTPSSSDWAKIRQINTGVNGGFHATLPVDVLIDAVYALKGAYLANSRWVMSRLTTAAVRKLKDADLNYLWQPSVQVGQPATLLGYPVQTAEDMPAIATNSLSIAFGDFRSAYTIVDRMGMRVLRDAFTDKPNVLFYTTKRVGGGVKNFEAVVLIKFAT